MSPNLVWMRHGIQPPLGQSIKKFNKWMNMAEFNFNRNVTYETV